MIVDTSALIALLNSKPDSARFAAALARSTKNLMAAPTYVECSVGGDRKGLGEGSVRFQSLLSTADIIVVDFDATHAAAARMAYREFGKGSGSKAQLNLGDCFSYGLAISMNEPLLWKGDDFTHTGVRSALEEMDL